MTIAGRFVILWDFEFLERSSLHEGRTGDLFHRKWNVIVTMASVMLLCCLARSYTERTYPKPADSVSAIKEKPSIGNESK